MTEAKGEKRQILISFVGVGKEKSQPKKKWFFFKSNKSSTTSSDSGYELTEYFGFPDGKKYSSSVFVESFINYKNAVGEPFDKMFIIGTYSSSWADLLPENDEYSDLKKELISHQEYFKECVGKEDDVSLKKLESELKRLCNILQDYFSIGEVTPVCHSLKIDEDCLPAVYDKYHGCISSVLNEKDSEPDKYEITVDITHGLRWMPLLCHQALSEHDIQIDHLIYGEKTGDFRDLSKSCAISRMNKALNLFNEKLVLKFLARELSQTWKELADVLFKIDNMFAFSAMKESYTLYNEFLFIIGHINEYADKIAPFDSFKGAIDKFREDWGYDSENYTDHISIQCVIILNVGEMFRKRGMILQAALANETAEQIVVMGRIFQYGYGEEYDSFNDEYKKAIRRYSIEDQKTLRNIEHIRNQFAHGDLKMEPKEVSRYELKIKSHNDFLRDMVRLRSKYGV